VLLYIDGMNGVIGHNNTVQWLYTLINSAVSISPYCLSFIKIALSVYEISSALMDVKMAVQYFICVNGLWFVCSLM